MPKVDGGVIISSGYAFLEPREPYSQHLLVGGNVQMLEILRNNVEELGLTASEAQLTAPLLGHAICCEMERVGTHH